MIRQSLYSKVSKVSRFSVPIGEGDAGNTGAGNTGAGSGSGSGTGQPAGGQGGSPPPAGGNTSLKDTSSGSKQGGDDDEDGDAKFDKKYVQDLRKEAAKHRKENQELAARLKALEDAQLTEQEKVVKRAKELEDENNRLRAETRVASIERVAARLGAVYPDAVAKLISNDEDDVEKAVAGVKKTHPQLFVKVAAGSADGGKGRQDKGVSGAETMNDWIRRAAGRGIQESS